MSSLISRAFYKKERKRQCDDNGWNVSKPYVALGPRAELRELSGVRVGSPRDAHLVHLSTGAR